MAKSKITESHTIAFEGIIDTDAMTIDVEEIGTVDISSIVKKFNGANVKVTVKLNNEVEEV